MRSNESLHNYIKAINKSNKRFTNLINASKIILRYEDSNETKEELKEIVQNLKNCKGFVNKITMFYYIGNVSMYFSIFVSLLALFELESLIISSGILIRMTYTILFILAIGYLFLRYNDITLSKVEDKMNNSRIELGKTLSKIDFERYREIANKRKQILESELKGLELRRGMKDG